MPLWPLAVTSGAVSWFQYKRRNRIFIAAGVAIAETLPCCELLVCK
jgi:hypothetical protein